MSATIIPLRRPQAHTGLGPYIEAISLALSAAERSGTPLLEPVLALRTTLDGHRDELMTVIEGLRAQDYRANPHLQRTAEEIETTAAMALTELGLLARRLDKLCSAPVIARA